MRACALGRVCSDVWVCGRAHSGTGDVSPVASGGLLRETAAVMPLFPAAEGAAYANICFSARPFTRDSHIYYLDACYYRIVAYKS